MSLTCELFNNIYQDNESHIEFVEEMASGDCDCNVHITLNTLAPYLGIKLDND